MSDQAKEPSQWVKDWAKNFALDHFGDWPGEEIAAVKLQQLVDAATASFKSSLDGATEIIRTERIASSEEIGKYKELLACALATKVLDDAATAEKDKEIERLKANTDGLLRQWKELATLLDQVPHNSQEDQYGSIPCTTDCPRCRWEAMKDGN